MSHFLVIPTPERRHPIMPWLICGIGALFYCYEYVLRISPGVMSHVLMRDFSLSAGSYGNIVAFYYYIYAPMQLLVGVLMDRYGPRLLLTFSCLACVAGSFLFGITHFIWLLAFGRFLIGLGSAFAFVGTLKLVTIWLPANRFAFLSGLVNTLAMVGAMVGNVVLNAMVDTIGWRTTMIQLAVLGAILTIFIFLIIRDRIEAPGKSHYQSEMDFKTVWLGLLESVKNKYIWINGLVGTFMYLAISAFAELWAVPYLVQAKHCSNAEAASLVTAIFFGWAVGAPLLGLLSDFWRTRKQVMLLGSLLGAITIAGILYIPFHSVLLLYVLLFIFGFVTSAQIIIFAVGRELSREEIAGTAISLTNMLVMLGGVLFQPLVGILLDFVWQGKVENGLHVYTTANYHIALSVLPIGLLLSAFFALLLRDSK